MRPGVVALGLVVALVASGCQYLYGFPPIDPDEGFEPPEATAIYESGRATIAIDGGATIVLDRLAAPGGLFQDFGASATFTGDDGWYLGISGALDEASTGLFGIGTFLQLDRITGTEHWTSMDPSRCIVDVASVDETGMRGSATCKGVRWSDMLGQGYADFEPNYIEGEAPFDAEITFEALPGPSQG